MNVGDLVIRKVPKYSSGPSAGFALEQIRRLGHGLVLSKQAGGSNPVHACVTVYYPKTGEIWDIAESLMEVVSESR